jgi:DNA-binding IclR family transcriptional regulator
MGRMSSLESGLSILGLLSRDRTVLRVGEVSRELGMPKASVSRSLQALAGSGLLEREPDGPGYVVGPRSIALSSLFLERRPLMPRVERAVDALVAEFGFTGFVSVLAGSEIVLVRVKQGSHPLRYVREVGTRLPSWRTAMGFALLSLLSDDDISARLAAAGPDCIPRDELQTALSAIGEARRCGLSVAGSFLTPGITTMSVAVSNAPTDNSIAMAVAFPDGSADGATQARLRASLLAHGARLRC